jgi:3-oxoacyl-[acyl-carrier-protein] synthase-3
MAGVRPDQLDLIVHASFTPSVAVPGDHVVVADRIGASATPSFTLTGACAGSVYGMALAYGMVASGAMRYVLVTGSETISPTLDFGDPLMAILFGDGAGAVLIGRTEGAGEGGMLPPYLGFEYNWENIRMRNANLPFSQEVVTPRTGDEPATVKQPFLRMTAGPRVLRNAVNAMSESVWRVLGYGAEGPRGAAADEVRAHLRVVPHQANGRIVDGITKKLGGDPLKTVKTIYRVGNISAASNLIALDYGMRHGNLVADTEPDTERIVAVREHADPIRKGELVVLPTIGAGYLFGAVGFVHRG